jgi:uncharacterized protein (TIGR02145 family)
MPVFIQTLPAGAEGSASQELSGTFTDSRDGQTYRWIRVGDQIWIAENLRHEAGEGCWAWNDDESTVLERGRYYNWQAAIRAVPPGWHLPTDEEWKELEIFLGMSPETVDLVGERGHPEEIMAGKLKSAGRWATEFRDTPVPVTGETGFDALPIGWRAQEQFFHEGYCGFWSSTDVANQAWMRGLHFFDDTITRVLNSKDFAFSVRCLRDR